MDKSLYFFVEYTSITKENEDDIYYKKSENRKQILECIYINEQYKKEKFYYRKIFKVTKLKEKEKESKSNSYYFEFEKGDEKYIISFDSKGRKFVYDVNLDVGKKIIAIRRKINQSKEYNEKIDLFIEALKQNKEENKIDDLYKETIELYEKKKGFSFLISLFLKIYLKKDLCSLLLEKFREMNEKPKDNEKNMDRKSNLEEYKSNFKLIQSEADKLIENKNYKIREFYGIILCYLNFYDLESFSSIINKLFIKNQNDLFEILLIYNAHFKYPINQDLDFLNQFINYTLNKEFSVFEIGLNYIRDIETFINIICKNKEKIFERYNSQKFDKIIKLDNLKFKQAAEIKDMKPQLNVENKSNCLKTIKEYREENNNNIRKKKENKNIFEILINIQSIIEFSKEKKAFLIYFTNNFWQYILNYYNEPTQDDIYICFRLREIFISYYNLVNEIFANRKNFTIKKDANNYFERDEFSFLLDQIIRQFINNNKELQNIEKLAYITQYNPYYIDPKYSNKVDCEIFDLFEFKNVDNYFIRDFKKMNFEIIFKENISEYIKKIFEKIKNISSLETIIKLINVEILEDKNIFLEQLQKSYDKIRDNIEFLNNNNKIVQVLAKLAIINYNYEIKEKKFYFIKKTIKKLDNKEIIPLIFIEIIKICFRKEDRDIEDEDEEEENKDDDKEKIIVENEEYKDKYDGKKHKTAEHEENKDDDKEHVFEENDNENIDYKEMKEFIFEEFVNKLNDEKDIENIIKLIDCLEGKDKKTEDIIYQKDKVKEKIVNEFLQKLMVKNLFTKEEFFSDKKNFKILLLCKLIEKGKIKKNEEVYYENITNLLDSIKKDIDGNIKKSKLE